MRQHKEKDLTSQINEALSNTVRSVPNSLLNHFSRLEQETGENPSLSK